MVKKGDKFDKFPYVPFLDKFAWLVPRKMYHINIIVKLCLIDSRYTPALALEDLNCERVFFGDMLGKYKK